MPNCEFFSDLKNPKSKSQQQQPSKTKQPTESGKNEKDKDKEDKDRKKKEKDHEKDKFKKKKMTLDQLTPTEREALRTRLISSKQGPYQSTPSAELRSTEPQPNRP
ncbi:hypothetical protein WR25_00075 [Diploscapter pachys]|uniref:Uncharacterized protein n=1 Tax=Diploscapter pachys TaxID=2018661 RepID=A0A2A2KE54_9BILA|nr:hypothetical protein WR25_00075 [Diploscapter pachys]